MDDYDEEDFQSAEVCYLCGLKPCEKGLVRDHCHWTGAYRGAACHSCNAQLVFKAIHNVAGFGHRPLIRAIAEISSPYPDYTATLIDKSVENDSIASRSAQLP